jgi:hypothetical protein
MILTRGAFWSALYAPERQRPILQFVSRAWPYLAAMLLLFAAKFPTLNNDILLIDEPHYLAQAARLDSLYAFFHWAEYYLEMKSSLSILPHIIALNISHPNAILVLRIFGLAALLISGVLMVRLSTVAFRTAIPGVWAVLFLTFVLANSHETAATNLEHFQLPLLLMSMLVFSLWLRNGRSSAKSLFLAGLFLGLATLVKPPALLVAPAAWAVASVSRRPRTRRELALLFEEAIVFGLGLLAPLLGFALPYLLVPKSLPALEFTLFDITSTYVTMGMDLATRFLVLFVNLGPATALVITWTVLVYMYARLRRLPDPSRDVDVQQQFLLLAGLALFIGNGIGQYKEYYLIAIVPPILIFAFYRLWLFYQRLGSRVLQAAFVALLVLFVAVSEVPTFTTYAKMLSDRGRWYEQQMPSVSARELAEYIRANTRPDDLIWVYAHAPELYWLSGRRPATSDPTASWLVIGYNDFWYARTYSELARDKPAIIVDLDQPRYQVHFDRLVDLPMIGELLAQQYDCRRDIFPDATICARRPQEATTR